MYVCMYVYTVQNSRAGIAICYSKLNCVGCYSKLNFGYKFHTEVTAHLPHKK